MRHHPGSITPLERRVLLAATLLHDFSPAGVDPRDLVAAGEQVFFSGSDVSSGRELWRSDGTPQGTRKVLDLRKSTLSADPVKLTPAGEFVFFAARGNTGWGIYRSDGTATGTVRLMAIAGAREFVNPKAMNDTLIFQMRDSDGYALWKSDGTVAGTVKVAANLTPSPFISTAADHFFIGVDTQPSRHRLIISDGTAAGTREIAYRGTSVVGQVATLGANAYFSSGSDKTFTLYRVKRTGRVDVVMEQNGRIIDAAGHLSYGPTPVTGVSVVPLAGLPGERPYAFVLKADTDPVVRLHLIDGASSADINMSDMPNGFLPPNSAFAVTPEADYFVTGNYSNKTQAYQVDPTSRKAVLLKTFNYKDRKFLADFESMIDAGRIGNSIFYVADTKSYRRYVELNLDTREGYLLQSIPKPENQLSDTMVGTSAGAFFPGTDESGMRELYFRAPAGNTVALTDAKGGPENTGFVTMIQTTLGPVVVTHTAEKPYIFNLDLVIDGNTTQRLATFGDNYDRARDITLFVEEEVLAIFVKSQANTGESLEELYTYSLTTGVLARCQTTGINTRLIGIHRKMPLIDASAFSGQRFVGISRPQTGVSSGLPYVEYARYPITEGSPLTFQSATASGTALFIATATDVYRTAPLSASRSIKGALEFASPLHAFAEASGQVFAANAETIYRYDESSGQLIAWVNASQLGVGFTLSSVVGGTALYAVGADAQDRWSLIRLEPANTPIRKTIAKSNEDWTRAGLGVPRVVASRSADVLLTASRGQSVSAVAVRNDVLDLQTRVDGLDGEVVLTDADDIVLRADPSRIYRLHSGKWSALTMPAEVDHPTLGATGLMFIASTPATGSEIFRYRFDTTISGNLYNDLDADLVKDAGEQGLSGWRIYIDRNDNGRYDKGEFNTLTDSVGNFEFFELDPGTHKLRISTGANYQMTTGTVYTVKLKAGLDVRKKFGARRIS